MIKSSDQKFNAYIGGKKVIFVGPSGNLIGSGFGKWIDSFDVIIRTNHAPIALAEDKSLAIDYGQRTDVLYINMQYYHKMIPDFPTDVWRKSGIKHLCMKRCLLQDLVKLKQLFNLMIIQNLCTRVGRSVPSPLMGAIIAQDISSKNPRKFYMTGIDNYASAGDGYAAYIPGYIPEKIQKVNREMKIGQGKGHDLRRNWEFMQEFVTLKKMEITFPGVGELGK
jgi:hypothetical protein